MAEVDLEKMQERLNRLLAMAGDTNSPEEAALAASKAAILMAKYGLEKRERDTRKGKVAETPREHKIGYSKDPKRQKWQSPLAAAVGKATFCYVLQHSVSGELSFFGTEEEGKAAIILYEWLACQVAFLSGEASAGKGPQFLADFCLGCSLQIGQRLAKEFASTAQAYPNGLAIVQASVALGRVEAGKKYTNITQGPPVLAKPNKDAFRQGKEAGARVDLKPDNKLQGTQASKLSGGVKALK